MTATEMHDLLRDSLAALCQIQVFRPGEYPGFAHINYCRFCHNAESIGHDHRCVIARLDRATDNGEAK